MKKRAMKKWIPNGFYCHGAGTKKNPYCKWRKYITTINRNKNNCEFVNDCKTEDCATCCDIVYRCEYMKYTDFKQESLLWDACKECGVKDGDD
jgi:hypothetical protein